MVDGTDAKTCSIQAVGRIILCDVYIDKVVERCLKALSETQYSA